MLTFTTIGIRDWRLARAALKLAPAAHADRATEAARAYRFPLTLRVRLSSLLHDHRRVPPDH